MALWKENTHARTRGTNGGPQSPLPDRSPVERPEPRSTNDPSLAVAPRRPVPQPRVEGGESVIAANLSIEGKIEGTGNVKMAGRFKRRCTDRR